MDERADSPVAAADRRLAALFPEEHGGRRRRRGAFVAVAVVVVGVVVALAATDAFGSSDPGDRTGIVARRTVVTTVHGVGTVEPVAQAKVAFPVAGTVANVLVVVGQPVVVGQTLATLDAQQLQAGLHAKQLALAQAELNLTNARNGTTSGPASTGSGGAGSGRAATTALVSGAPAIALTAAPLGAGGSLAAAQQAVLDAQQQVDAALAAAASAQQSAQTTCAAAGVTVPGAPPATTTSTSTTTTPSGTALTACQAALTNLMHAQQTVTDAQRALTRAEHELDARLAQQASASGSAGGGTNGSGANGGGGSASARGTTTGPTAADLASYQSAVDSAAAAVAVAEQAVQQGTIVSPMAGTVTAVDLAVGQSVTAGSTTATVIVTGPGGFEVSTDLGVTEVPHVALGDAATVVPDGAHRAYSGKVVSISALPSSVTSTATDYLVVVGLDRPDAPLTNGDLGAVTIVTRRVAGALSVPTSAVTAVGTRHLVQVLRSGGDPRTVVVGVGTVGASWTQVTSGLHAGDRVVIADLSTPLPGAATSSANGTTGSATSRFQGLFRGAGAGGGFNGGFGGGPGGGFGAGGGAGR